MTRSKSGPFGSYPVDDGRTRREEATTPLALDGARRVTKRRSPKVSWRMDWEPGGTMNTGLEWVTATVTEVIWEDSDSPWAVWGIKVGDEFGRAAGQIAGAKVGEVYELLGLWFSGPGGQQQFNVKEWRGVQDAQ